MATFLCLKCPDLWCCVTAALGSQRRDQRPRNATLASGPTSPLTEGHRSRTLCEGRCVQAGLGPETASCVYDSDCVCGHPGGQAQAQLKTYMWARAEPRVKRGADAGALSRHPSLLGRGPHARTAPRRQARWPCSSTVLTRPARLASLSARAPQATRLSLTPTCTRERSQLGVPRRENLKRFQKKTTSWCPCVSPRQAASPPAERQEASRPSSHALRHLGRPRPALVLPCLSELCNQDVVTLNGVLGISG